MKGQTTVLQVGGLHWATSQSVVEKVLPRRPGVLEAAHTQTHNHYWSLRLTREATREEILDSLRSAPRIAFVRMADGLTGLTGLNTTVELMRDLGRPRGDMWEVALWEDVLTWSVTRRT